MTMHYAFSDCKPKKCQLHFNSRYSTAMTSMADRLREARERAGYETAKLAAEAMGVPTPSYTQHENGIRGFKIDTARQYARFFKVSPEWLLYGIGDMETLPSLEELQQMVALAIGEMPASATLSDWPRLAAPILQELLSRWQADAEGQGPH